MFLPESMSRVVITGSKARIDDVTDALFKSGVVHLIDYTTGMDEGFSIGAPRPYSSKASERLLALRAVEKEFSNNPATKKYEYLSAYEINTLDPLDNVENVCSEVMAVVDGRNKTVQEISELKNQKVTLSKLSKLSIDLECYSGYENLTVFVGSAKTDPSSALSVLKNIEYEVVLNEKEEWIVAVFAPNTNRDDVSTILSNHGYSEIIVPEMKGSPTEALSQIQDKILAAEDQVVKADDDIAELFKAYSSFVAKSDKELSTLVMKGETPLRIATSDFSFVIDGWVPTADIKKVQKEIYSALGDSVYVEIQEERSRSEKETEEAEHRFKKVPTKWKNGAYGKLFEFPVSLLSIPKYNELDPSTIIGLFFPFFFGFMVGDLGYAIPFIILGAYGFKHAESQEFKAISTLFLFGGIWAAIFGFLFFGEMLGMHFHLDELSKTDVTWESLLSVTLPDWFRDIFVNGHGVSKLHDVTFLLKLSVYIGVVHLALAYIIKFVNVKMREGFKSAYFEAGSWIISFSGMIIFCYGLTNIMFGGSSGSIDGMVMGCLIIGGSLLVIGVASCWPKEGIQAILELPGIIGNVLSYTRLTAIGMSKAGMALAFNYISIKMLSHNGDAVGVMFGVIVFVIGHVMIWALAILSAGLHGLRLQYVEMMNKFFIGGGKKYTPLARK